MAFTAIAVWIALAFAVEFIVDILKQMLPILDTKIKGIDNERIMALLFGLLICYGAKVDFFDMLGIAYSIPYVGAGISALFIAGGSGKLHDFIKGIANIADQYRKVVPEPELEE